MKYYLDTEFHEYKKQPGFLGIDIGKPIDTIELISIGIVAEDGKEYYALCKDFNVEDAWNNEWLRENVLYSIFQENSHCMSAFTLTEFKEYVNEWGKSKGQIANEIENFADHDPEFYAYYADYDWVVFCWLFGRMIDLSEGFPMYCRDLKQMKDDLYISDGKQVQSNITDDNYRNKFLLELGYPVQKNEHNALEDAKWNRSLHEFIDKF